jgi:hypothetical protein
MTAQTPPRRRNNAAVPTPRTPSRQNNPEIDRIIADLEFEFKLGLPIRNNMWSPSTSSKDLPEECCNIIIYLYWKSPSDLKLAIDKLREEHREEDAIQIRLTHFKAILQHRAESVQNAILNGSPLKAKINILQQRLQSAKGHENLQPDPKLPPNSSATCKSIPKAKFKAYCLYRCYVYLPLTARYDSCSSVQR